MVKKLHQIGNSYGVILDRALLDSIGVDRDGRVEITTDGKCLTIRPVGPADGDRDGHKARVRKSARRMYEIHRETFQKLAK